MGVLPIPSFFTGNRKLSTFCTNFCFSFYFVSIFLAQMIDFSLKVIDFKKKGHLLHKRLISTIVFSWIHLKLFIRFNLLEKLNSGYSCEKLVCMFVGWPLMDLIRFSWKLAIIQLRGRLKLELIVSIRGMCLVFWTSTRRSWISLSRKLQFLAR